MTAIMALTLSVGFSAALGMGSVQAAEGWTKINEEWRYYDQNDQLVTPDMEKVKGLLVLSVGGRNHIEALCVQG